MPPFSVGVPVTKLLLRSIKLSAIVTISVSTIVLVPLTVKLPVMITSPETVPPEEEYFVFATPNAELA